MSLINQMLQDLEKRRASVAERGALPNQVRVLPRTEKAGSWWGLPAIGAVAVAAGLAVWQFAGPNAGVTDKQILPARTLVPATTAPVVPPAAEMAAENTPRFQAEAPASRLALELARVPESPPSAAIVEEPRSVSKGPAAAQPKAIKPPLSVGQTPSPPTTGIALKPAAAVIEAKPVMMSSPANEVPPVVKPRIVEAVSENSPQTAPSAARIDKQVKQLTPAQAAENEYREAANFLNQGRIAEAQESFRQALQHNPGHIGARQGLFGLMVDARRPGEAEQLLREGLKLNANQPGFAMALARLQLDRNDVTAAIETLQGSAAGAQNSPDYLAFHAALLQRQTRHREAAEQYQAALRLAPQSGVWLMGLGISLQALNRTAEAQDAFRRARASNSLSADLQAFVEQRLRQLQ